MSEDNSPGWPKRAPQVGARAERTRRVSHDDIRSFTDISGDCNPLHYDAEVAGASR